MQALRATPFNLAWGQDVYAKVAAINAYGVSLTSVEGNGAKIITYASAPILLGEDYSKRTATSLSLTWSPGSQNGGSEVIDYQISYDNASGATI